MVILRLLLHAHTKFPATVFLIAIITDTIGPRHLDMRATFDQVPDVLLAALVAWTLVSLAAAVAFPSLLSTGTKRAGSNMETNQKSDSTIEISMSGRCVLSFMLNNLKKALVVLDSLARPVAVILHLKRRRAILITSPAIANCAISLLNAWPDIRIVQIDERKSPQFLSFVCEALAVATILLAIFGFKSDGSTVTNFMLVVFALLYIPVVVFSIRYRRVS